MRKVLIGLIGMSVALAGAVALLNSPSLLGADISGARHGKGYFDKSKHVKGLVDALAAIDEAMKEIQSGDKDKGLADLQKARGFVDDVRIELIKPPKAVVVNTHCPMSGKPIDSAKVPENLTCDYRGHKVGFCCPGCSGPWDKLSDAEKATKLDKVLPGASEHSGH